MHHQKLAIVIFFALWPIHSYAQDDAQSESEKLFASTFWEPNKGVKLLKASSAKKTWTKYEKKCELPRFTDSDFPITSHYVFKTSDHIIFVYNKSMDTYKYWTVCDQHTKENLFESQNYGSGYDILKDGSIKTFGSCSDSRAAYTNVRFRPYMKDQLMLEMNFHICQQNENHHEFLFHLDESGLKEIEGSRFVLADDVHGPFIYWKHHGETYSQLGVSSLNEDGERTWSRRLEVVLRNVMSKHPVWEFQCKYNETKRRVDCTKSLVQKVKLASLLSENPKNEFCEELETKWNLLPEIEKLGFIVTEEARSRLKSERDKKCAKISQ